MWSFSVRPFRRSSGRSAKPHTSTAKAARVPYNRDVGVLHFQPILRSGRAIAEALYTQRCAECNRRGAWVCARCLVSPMRIVPAGCTRCWAAYADDCLCPELPPDLERVSAAYPYSGWVRSAVIKFKFEDERSRAGHLAEHMAPLIDQARPPDLLVPVPLHSDRQRTRGYNQAELLARKLSEQSGIPLGSGLVRRVERGHQVGRNKTERWDAVKDAFACPDPDLVRGKRIVVVDDVITTGATVANCAIALQTAGSTSVSAISVARG